MWLTRGVPGKRTTVPGYFSQRAHIFNLVTRRPDRRQSIHLGFVELAGPCSTTWPEGRSRPPRFETEQTQEMTNEGRIELCARHDAVHERALAAHWAR